MNLKSLKHEARLLALAGAAALALGIGGSVVSHKTVNKQAAGSGIAKAILSTGGIQIADGSESTGGGKPPKPKNS